MSRIYEALKKAEEERELTGLAEEAKPGDCVVAESAHSGEAAHRASVTLLPLRLGDAPPTSCKPRLDELRQRCTKPRWKLDPDTIVFCNKPSFTRCAEQFRTLRSRLYRLRGTLPIRTLLVTSTFPGEGKTFVALNLAQAIVRQRERRALLIDTDLRASRLHVPMGAPSAPGLADYLLGEADEFSIMQADPQGNLFLIPAGRPVTNPAELLADTQLKGLLDRLAPMFDWIILDSPPVLPVSDASVVAGLCDGVIFVVQAGSTAFDLAQTACQEFQDKNLLGVVLNRGEEEASYPAYSYYDGNGRDKT
jgi:capsular exopolysaccharide synthesis family protein